MCGRYYIPDEPDETLRQIIAAVNRRPPAGALKCAGEVFPSDVVPVVANSRAMKPAAFAMRWGYALDGGRRVINARSETAEAKPMFRDGMLRRRCLIPAGHYFEWARSLPGKPKYAIRPRNEGLMWMAGLYRPEPELPAFVVLTRPPADDLAFIHDRMPVLLSGDAARAWLNLSLPPAGTLERAELNVRFAREGNAQMGMEIE